MPTIDPPQTSPAKPSKRWGLWILGLLVLAGIGAYIAFYLYEPTPPSPFQITSVTGSPEIYKSDTKTWETAQKGDTFGTKDILRTDGKSEVDLKIEGKAKIRVKPNSELENKRRDLFDAELTHELHLLKGSLLGATEDTFKENGALNISTPVLVAAIRGTLFQIDAQPQTDTSIVSVLRGEVEVTPNTGKNAVPVTVGNVHKVIVKGGQVDLQPVRISRDDWMNMREAYDLVKRSAEMEAMQLNLSKEAGDFFEFVFDTGTFFSQNFGFADREFIKDPLTGKVFLKVEYDVFPRGSYVGVYIKIRDLDASKYQGLAFDARYVADEAFPDEIRVELKSKGSVQRAMAPKGFKRDWTRFEFPFSATRELPINEMVYVFNHSKVGESKRGVLLIKDVNMIPLTQDEIDRRAKIAEADAERARQEAEAIAAKTQVQTAPSAAGGARTTAPGSASVSAEAAQKVTQDEWANF